MYGFGTVKIRRPWLQGLLAGWLGLLLASLAVLASPATVRAHAGYDRSTPAANASLPGGQMPSQVQVWFTENLELRFSELTVVDKDGQRVDSGDSRGIQGDPKGLVVSLKPGLPDGPYTVIFKNVSAEDGHTVKGSFAFLVGAGQLPTGAGVISPLDLAEQQTTATGDNANFWTISLRWLNYLSGTALVGALGYALLVWQAAIRRARAGKRMGPQLEMANELGLGRVRLVAWLGLGGLVLGWLGWFLYQSAAFSSQNIGQLFGLGAAGQSGPSAFADFLFSSRYGGVWLVRLGLIVLTSAAWIVALGGPAKGRLPGLKSVRQNLLPTEESNSAPPSTSEEARSKTPGLNVATFETRRIWWWVTAVLGGAVLLTTSLNSHAASVQNWAWLAIGGDWLHLLSTALWVGGLLAMALGLAVAIPALLPGSGDRTRLLAALIPAFSQVAILSVMALLVSGTLSAALHLSDLTELYATPYGLSLMAKIVLLVPLLLLAAYNLLVVSPRMRVFAKSKKAGPKEGAGSIAAGMLGQNFRRSVLAEVGLALLVLIAAALLTSNAPPRSLAASKVVYIKAEQANLKIDFAASPASVGENTFEVRLTDKSSGQPVTNASLVDLRLTHLDMEMGEPRLELKAASTAPGRYLGQGPVLSMSGNWQGTLIIQRSGQEDVRLPVNFKVK